MAYRAALERLCRACPYRGFESRPLRSSLRYERRAVFCCAANGGPFFRALRTAESVEEKLNAIGICAVRFCTATKES